MNLGIAEQPVEARDLLEGLPGADLVEAGFRDLAEGRVSEPALLMLIAAPRLRRLGLTPPTECLPASMAPLAELPYEHRLYALLEIKYEAGAYSRYNSLLRRLASFCSALEHRMRWMGGAAEETTDA